MLNLRHIDKKTQTPMIQSN